MFIKVKKIDINEKIKIGISLYKGFGTKVRFDLFVNTRK